MSFQAMTWACGQELPCNQKIVLLMLANRTNPDTGQCTPSHERLTRDCGMSKTTVKECIARLETAGLLDILRRSSEGVSLPNSYRLLMSEVGREPTHPTDNGLGVGRQATEGGAPGDRGVGRQPATKQRTETENETEKRNKALARPDDVSPEVWTDFVAMRKAKQAPITATGLAGIEREAVKAGYTIEAALRECCERGWRGFKADWVKSDGGAIRQPQRMSHKEAAREKFRSDFDEIKRKQAQEGAGDENRDDGVIDV